MLAVFDEIGALDVTLSYIPELKITYLSEVLVSFVRYKTYFSKLFSSTGVHRFVIKHI